LISAFFVHIFFIIIIFIMLLIYKYPISIYNFQVIYYFIAMSALLLGLSWITSSIIVFFKDLGQIIGILLQFGFWLTPIFWSYSIMPTKYQYLLKLNPLYYIIQGYRNSFIDHVWFWQNYNQTTNFWIITTSLFIIGVLIFKRLRPHFADVL
jgi:ABC-type polysaccharide/polyol phosphate export permease